MEMTMDCDAVTVATRRAVLGTAGALFAWSFMPRFAHAAGRQDKRLIVIILRGALDGLSAVAPIGDPAYLSLRAKTAIRLDSEIAPFPLNDFFLLHPSLKTVAALYGRKQALILHAVATGYRSRSHFDGQDVLESGQPVPGLSQNGWLNRAIALIPKGEGIARSSALGVGVPAPLVIRGDAPILGWAPQALPEASDDLGARVLALYDHSAPEMAKVLRAGLETEALLVNGKNAGARQRLSFIERTAQGTAKLMAADDGPRIAALALDGWDTHANQGGVKGQLATRLTELDRAIAVLAEGLADVWSQTTIAVVTEFGRTAHENGSDGSDHGTGTAAFLIGGAVKGGQVIADWPGLAATALHEGRDLKATVDLRAVMKGVLKDGFDLSDRHLSDIVFPETSGLKPLGNLLV
jgi:uncharacterized protein (DUF1501 family)